MSGGDLITTAAVGCVAAFVLTPLAAAAARRLALLDVPGGYKGHAAPTPLGGGLAVAGGATGAVVAAAGLGAPVASGGMLALAVGGAAILAAGLLDDVRGLSPPVKVAWQLAATAGAAVTLAAAGVRLELFLDWPVLPIALLTVLWIVAVTNAVNFLDNMDGLCAGIGALAGAALAAANFRSGEPGVAAVAAALAGACLGFLPHNWPRARVFLGDAGSMAIGFVLAGLAVMGVYARGAAVPVLAVYVPLLALAVPLLDLVLVVALRLRDGRAPWLPDRRHLSHRLVSRGMRPPAAVATLWAAGAACATGALLLPAVGAEEAPLLLLCLAFALGAVAAAAGTRGLP